MPEQENQPHGWKGLTFIEHLVYAKGLTYITLILLITNLTGTLCCVHFREKETGHREREACPSPPAPHRKLQSLDFRSDSHRIPVPPRRV